ncbi:MAG: PLP-dependent aminotransferase family protein [Castellaniella sp.]|uniref:aminotransferase-like domain-containing protein n=1 Tax=Castellaniella sp. TaxID=1955812 RepID=UPI001221D17A|nr:PLP-dependent aminotransferase family protein [Castellaniella sp.]TAN29090.1 MAG: PLP-dependent aminotransferase family protein [Castellaniella sp.]
MQLFIPERHPGRHPTLVDQTTLAIERAIHERTLRSGMTLPSVRQFARDHGLSTFTVVAAYNRLVARGLLQSRPGSDFRVARQRPPARARTLPNWEPPPVGPSWLLSDIFADHSISIKAGCGWLPPDWHNESGLQRALRQLARVPVSQIAAYGHPLGYQPLREHVAQRLQGDGLEAVPDQILLTHGATQALDIAARTLLRPGDHAAVEMPCYANLLQILAINGVVVHGVPRTPDGLCEKTLRSLAAQYPLRTLFVTTVLQNPTGASFTMTGAFRLLQLAEQHNFVVVEDDVSRELLLEPRPSLAALANPGRVVYVSGFSKSVMPSLRVGYLVSTPDQLRQFARTKMSLGLTSAEIMERAVYQVLCDGRHSAYLRGVRERLRVAHDQVCQAMEAADFEIAHQPDAGLFLWARPRVPIAHENGTIGLAAEALQSGIWLAPGAYFYPDGRDEGWFRFNVAYSGHPRLWKFFRDAAIQQTA